MSVAEPILECIKTIKTQAQLLRSTSAFRDFLSAR